MGTKTLHKDLNGNYTFTDTRTLEEAREENFARWREATTNLILYAGFDEIWQRNAGLGVIEAEQVEQGRAYIINLRAAYHDYKARLLASNRDEADDVQFLAPPVPENI